jgi:septum formation protein
MISQSLSPLILASASPRRKALLESMGYDFEVYPSEVKERLREKETPEENAERLACLKARSVRDQVKRGTIIGCDTVVAVGTKVLGKPDGPEDARKILSFLSGKVQRVISGLCLISATEEIEISGYDVTRVYTKPMSAEEIDAYIATGECFGKAGAYAIQETGDRFIERLEGSFNNVVGFPSELFVQFLEALANQVEEPESA